MRGREEETYLVGKVMIPTIIPLRTRVKDFTKRGGKSGLLTRHNILVRVFGGGDTSGGLNGSVSLIEENIRGSVTSPS